MINTYYWKDRIKNPIELWYERSLLRQPWHNFRYGNAGDIFNENLIEYLYPKIPYRITTTGSRILLVGSIAHRSNPGDIICGIGCKEPLPPNIRSEDTIIYGLRGPISYDEFKKAKYDISKVKFLADPGLLIRNLSPKIKCIPNRVIFIPHYRERKHAIKALPKNIKFVDIDNDPIKVATEIQRAELVLSSSLHGIIFSHALNRPAVFIKPSTEEPILKYQDYYSSININFPKPLSSVEEIDFKATPISPISIDSIFKEFFFPDIEELKFKNIYN